MRRLMNVAAVASLLALAACMLRPGPTMYNSARPDNSPVVVNVTNYYGLPVEVSAVGAGTAYRMGTVHPGMVSHFVLRQAMLASGGMVEFVAQPAGREPPVRSGELLLTQGDVVDFEITTHLIASYASVRP